MSRASRLAPIADYAGTLEVDAARRLATSARALNAKEAEVERLRGYLAEYRQRAALEQQSTDSLRWQNTRAFLVRLGEAVAVHEADLAKAVEQHRLEAERWRASHQRSQTLDKVIERAQREELFERAQRDQADLDELMAQHVRAARR
jgi:flagellar export protein FliJ